MKMIRRLSCYIVLALSAGLAAFSVAAMASGPGFYLAKTVRAFGDMQAASMQKLNLTLAQWRTQGQDTVTISISGMRHQSNGFVFNSVKMPDVMSRLPSA